MGKTGIIILSDLHCAQDSSKSRLNTQDQSFLTKFLAFLKKRMQDEGIVFKYLLIAGDLVEEGKKAEYEVVKGILEKISNRLGIRKEHILIVPGNHDVSRDRISVHCEDNGIAEEEAYQYMDVKFQNYIEFYKEFMGIEEYSLDKAIVKRLDLEECNISVLGVNSNVLESHRGKDHVGYIDEDKLMQEVEDLPEKRNYLVLTHHSWADDRQMDLPTIKNADNAKDIFRNRNIRTYMYGHHHALDSKKVEDRKGKSQYYEIGSFSKVLSNAPGESYNNVFVAAVIDEETPKLTLSNYIYQQNDWELLPGRSPNELAFDMKEEQPGKAIEPVNAFMDMTEKNKADVRSEVADDLIVGEDSEKYLRVIAENKLYREGHYHWANGEKTRGWINISAFLGNQATLSNLRKDFKRFYTMLLSKGEKIDAVIGYGMEGNILGSSLTPVFLKNEVKYLYYPSVHKGKNYIEAEKIAWNQASQVKSVIFIFDFVPSNHYMREIIESGKSFESVEKLFVFSVFSIRAEEELASHILLDKKKEGKDNAGERKISVGHYTACRLVVPECEVDAAQCSICTNHLAEVIKL